MTHAAARPVNRPNGLIALAIAALTGGLGAAEPLATWRSGPGTVSAAAVAPGDQVPEGAPAAAGEGPVRLDLARAPATAIYLAPGSLVRLREQDGDLLVELDGGAVQLNVASRGPYRTIHVLGAVMDVQVTGTLFVVERSAGNRDFLALVEGRVKVDPRAEVRRLLTAGAGQVELTSRQSLGAGLDTGLEGVSALAARPQLPTTPGAMGVRAQAAAGVGTGWDEDAAGAATDPPAAGAQVAGDQVRDGVAASVVEAVNGQVVQSVSSQVQQQVIQGAGQPQPLGGHPPLPGP